MSLPKQIFIFKCATLKLARPEIVKKVLRSLIKAEEFAKTNPEQAIKLVAEKLNVKEAEIKELWPDMIFAISLDQTNVISLEGIARWVIQSKLADKTQVPNYLGFCYLDTLKAVKPETVSIIK